MKKQMAFINTNFDVRYEDTDIGCNIPVFSYHDVYEIYVLKTGERTTIINDKLYKTPAMTAALFPSRALHRSYGDTPYSGVCFHFSESYIDKYFSINIKKKFLKCFAYPIISLNENEMTKINDIAEKIKNKSEWNFLYLGKLMELLSTAATVSQVPCPVNSSAKCSSKKLSSAMEYINNNYTEVSSCSDVCSALSISESYLHHGFKNQTGMTISQYINTLRIQYACRMLETSNKTIGYISEECGFESVSYFIRSFKKRMNCTPTEYRKLLQIKCGVQYLIDTHPVLV